MAEKEGYEVSLTNIPILTVDKFTELTPEDPEAKEVRTPLKKRRSVAEDDSDSDIEIIMSPTARKKKSSPPAEKKASPTMKTSPKHWMTEIPNVSPDDKQATKRRIFGDFAEAQPKKQKLPAPKISAFKEVEDDIILLD